MITLKSNWLRRILRNLELRGPKSKRRITRWNQAASVVGPERLELRVVPAVTYSIATTGFSTQTEGSGNNRFGWSFEVSSTGSTDPGDPTPGFSYQVTGSGTHPANGSDFEGGTLPSGSFVSFNANTIVNIKVDADFTAESDEEFTITLTGLNGATIGTASAIGRILNDDSVFSMLPIAARKFEGNVGSGSSFKYKIIRTGATEFEGRVHYAVSGNGEHPANSNDFDFVGGFPNGDLNFTFNATEKILEIRSRGDNIEEFDEGFIVTLSDPKTGVALGSTAIGTIVNDDSTFSITPDNAVRPEGNNGATPTPFTFLVSRTGSTSIAAEVDYEVSGSGPNPANADDAFDVSKLEGTISFGANQTSSLLTLPVRGDATIEMDEGFTVTLFSSVSGTPVASASGTILDDDRTFLSIKRLVAVNSEGHSGNKQFTFTVKRTLNVGNAVSVNYSVSGNANAPASANAADFGGVFPSGLLRFNPGETTKTITINVSGDTTIEPLIEGFRVTLSNPVGAILLTASASGEILNDDTKVSIGPLLIQELEGNGVNARFTFNVTRIGDTFHSQNVSYSVPASGTLNQADFVGGVLPFGKLTFNQGEFQKEFTILVNGDLSIENDEIFLVKLLEPSLGVLIETGKGTAQATILSDDFSVRVDKVAGMLSLTEVNGLKNSITVTRVTTLSSVNLVITSLANDLSLNGINATRRILIPANQITVGLVARLGVGDDKLDVSTSSLSATVEGGNGMDTILTGIGQDSLDGGAGNDLLNGGEGNDTLTGGSGNDQLIGAGGSDLVVDSVSGTVTLAASSMTTTSSLDNFSSVEGVSLTGSPQDDVINAGTATIPVTLDGGLGNDQLTGGSKNDSLLGGGGDDWLLGNLGNDVLRGGDGTDRLEGDSGADKLFGDGDNDKLFGGFGKDTLDGGMGDDVLLGEDGDDSLFGDIGGDVLSGGKGADQLDGFDGNDTLLGGLGNDNLRGGNDTDLLIGDEDNDLLEGGTSIDSLSGGAGENTLVDTINGTADDTTDDDLVGIFTFDISSVLGE